MKRLLLKLVAGALLLATPLAVLAADTTKSSSGSVLLLTSDAMNASLAGLPAVNSALKKEVQTFTAKLKSLIESTGRTVIANDTSNSDLTNPGHSAAVALATLLPQQMAYIGTVYWGPDEANNIMIIVDFLPVTYLTKGSAKLGDKNYGKKLLFLADGSGVPASTAGALAEQFNAHLRETVFVK